MMKYPEKLHPAILDLHSDMRRGRMTRREFLRLAMLLGTSAATAGLLAGCNPQRPVAPPTNPVTIQRGGTLRIGTAVQAVDHPARLAWIEAANQLRQVAEYLTLTDSDNVTHPWLLESGEPDESLKTWTLRLKQGIKFNNGVELTADDVIFNFEQWLDPTVESSMTGLLSYLSAANIEKVDSYTVRLHLNEPQIGVLEHLFHYPALILPHTFEGDFIKQPVGTGPFNLVRYEVGEQAVFQRREDYWNPGADGQPLPYLAE
jgi:peptide/nickel transport system substrate-binding protein